MSQGLTVRHQTQLEEILKGGNAISPVTFAKRVKYFKKIRNINEQDARIYLGLILTKAAFFAGVKDPISDLNKKDISEMIMTRYSGLTLEEIDFAFKHNRYSGEPVQHYQLFNAEYVAIVLKNYKNYITQLKFDNNISISEPPKLKNYSSEEKEKIDEDFLKMVYNELRECGFSNSSYLLWSSVKDKHNKTIEVMKRLYKVQKQKFLRNKVKGYDFEKDGGKKSVENICRRIMVINYLKSHLSDFKTFKSALDNHN